MYSANYKKRCITKADLKKAKPENLLRLANWLKLYTDGMSHRQIAKLVWWRITRDTVERYF